MSKNTGSSKHVAIEQVKLMIDFMGQHVDFASGKLRTLEARHKSKALWEELAALLNDCNVGVRKSSDGWSKYWSDWKNKLKNKVQTLKNKGCSNGHLTKLEKRALVILGPGFDKLRKKNNITGSATNEDNHLNDLPPVIKLETYQDNNVSGDERLSDESQSSNDDNDEDSNQNSSERFVQNGPFIHNTTADLYPPWLIEVEKKRADADLLRAKAEEQRASNAGKAAEAALLQADALKKLAEATSNQADALLRIALVLEARGERDVLDI